MQRYTYEDVDLSLFIIMKYWRETIIKAWLLRSWLNKGDKNRFSNSTKMNHFAMGIRQAPFQLCFQPSLINLTEENFLPLDNQCHEAFSIQTVLTGFY